MKDKDKIVDLSQYRDDKFFEVDLLKELEELGELSFDDLDALDDFYDEIAFGGGAGDGKVILEDLDKLESELSTAMQVWQNLPEKSWYNLEARPCLALMMELAILYKQHGLYKKALELVSMVYQENPNDSLGARYEIMALHVLTSDYHAAEMLFLEHPDYQDDILILAPLLVAAILQGDLARIDQMVEKLLKLLPEFEDFARSETFPLSEVLEAGGSEYYEHNSLDSLYLALYNIIPLLMTASTYVQAYLNRYFESGEHIFDEGIYLEELGVLSSAQLMALTQMGIRTVEDIVAYSEEELLTIPTIGKATLKKLEKAGVEIKQS